MVKIFWPSSDLHHLTQCNELLWTFSPLSCRPSGFEHRILHPWVTVNLVVALLVGLAWIFMASQPERDYTEGLKQDWTFTLGPTVAPHSCCPALQVTW